MLEALLLRTSDDQDQRHETDYYISLAGSVFFATLFFTGMAVLLTRHLIPLKIAGTNLGGIMTVLIATIALSYPLTNYIRRWDQEELTAKWEAPTLLRRHLWEILTYLGAFLGATLIFAIATIALPESFFQAQIEVLKDMGALTGKITSGVLFSKIVSNNLSLFFVTFGLSFLITGGMVFIIIWNASILGVLVGRISTGVLEIPAQTAPYLLHGLIEIAAYILAGLSGSLLAYSLEHYIFEETHSDETFGTTLGDSIAMLVAGVIAIVIAAMIETGYML